MLTGNDYIPISAMTLLPTDAVGLDLYQQVVDDPDHDHDEIGGNNFRLYRGSNYPLTVGDLERLRNRGVRRLFIEKSSQPDYQKHLRNLAYDASGKSFPIPARASALNEVVRDVLQSAFAKNVATDQRMAATKNLGTLAAEIICHDDFAANDLLKVLNHDYATFTHSANVAFYCGILASELDYSQRDIQQVITGGLLHDLGKLEIDESILCKPRRLDEIEMRSIRMHPLLGFRKLAQRSDINEAQLMMVYQHHERIDGSGYPVGQDNDGIHPWAKICAVVDVFEALTSQRPYRSPMSFGAAIELLRRDSGTAFDPEILQCWITIIQRSFAK